MKKTITVLLGVLLLCGCAMKEFSSTPFYSGTEVKYTGAVEDRINLWPVAYWREPVGSVAWPLVSFGDDHFALRPVYSQYKKSGKGEFDEYNVLWPLAQFDTDDQDYRIFPFFWGKDYSKDPYFCLFPLAWYNDEFSGVFPIFWNIDNGTHDFCVFPLFWFESREHRNSLMHTLFPLYYYKSKDADNHSSSYSDFWALCGLTGCNKSDSKIKNHWLLPFYIWDEGDFYSLPYSRYNEGPFLLKTRYLLGLAGDDYGDGKYSASWLFPLYYHDRTTDEFLTPLYGHSRDTDWLIPLFYKDKERFITPLYGQSEKAKWMLPLFYKVDDSFYTFLYGHTKNSQWLIPFFYRDQERLLTPIYGQSKDENASWLMPLYYKDKNCFLTAIFGRNGDDEWLLPIYFRDKTKFSTALFSIWNNPEEDTKGFFSLPILSGANWSEKTDESEWFALGGLAGTRSGRRNGWWAFPFYETDKSSNYDKYIAYLDKDKLPDEIVFTDCIQTNWQWNAKKKCREDVSYYPYKAAKGFWEFSDATLCIVSRNERRLSGYAGFYTQGKYVVKYSHEQGNEFAYFYDGSRCVEFDAITRKKVSDFEEGESSLFFFIYNSSHNFDRITGKSYASKKVLFRLVDWEEENGDIALDVFPGFTYDSKKDGYTKTSFLWRLFRYENDPKKGTAVDLLFIPIWRAGK